MIVQRSFFEINDSQNLKVDFPWPFDPKTRPTCRSKQTLTLFFCDLHLNKVPLKKDMRIMKVQKARVNKISMSGRSMLSTVFCNLESELQFHVLQIEAKEARNSQILLNLLV